MPPQQPEGRRQGRKRFERQPHHISSIAHLFFAGEEDADPIAGLESARNFAVTCFNDSRISAYACAGLVAGARTLAAAAGRWGVRLEEDPTVLWSAGSFLPQDGNGVAGSPARPDAPLMAWEWPGPGMDGKSASLLRWRHLQALKPDDLTNLEMRNGSAAAASAGWSGRPVSPGGGGLVACLLAQEMGQWGPAFQLGRLMGLLGPRRLEILVFPDAWAESGGRERTSADREAGPTADLLARCRGLTRAVAGACSVTITTLPPGGSTDREISPGSILQKMAARLVADDLVADF